MPPRIVVVGSYNADLVTYMPSLPMFGETVSGHRFETGAGGKGSNQAVAAARLGADVCFVGRVGTDNYADVGFQLWEEEHITHHWVARDPDNPTGIASIFVDDSGENMIALAPGANMALTPGDIDAAADMIAQADVLLTQLEIPLETVEHALKLARSKGVKTILNPAPARSLPESFLALADYLTPNESEVEILTGVRADTLEHDAQKLLSGEQQVVIVTMGAWGVIWVRQNEQGHLSAFEVEAVDTVGAGDAFNAGLAVALAEGKTLEDALRFATAAAAVSVTRPGAADSMPRRSEVDALLQQPRDE